MIQDIAPHRLRNEYDPQARPAAEDLVITFDETGRVLSKANEYTSIDFPTVLALGEDLPYQYLFRVDDVTYWMLWEKKDLVVPEGYDYLTLMDVRKYRIGPREQRYALYTAKHLDAWYSSSKFCGKCGGAAVHDQTERAMTCSVCGSKNYPRIMPAVIVGVRNGDKLLLTKYATGFRENALIAGFVEIGETAEETVAREVMEEAGVKVKNVQYYKSQPWGVVSDLLLGYYCDVDGDDTITMDANELKYAEWVKREDIILQTNDDSLTNEMMTMFKNGLK